MANKTEKQNWNTIIQPRHYLPSPSQVSPKQPLEFWSPTLLSKTLIQNPPHNPNDHPKPTDLPNIPNLNLSHNPHHHPKLTALSENPNSNFPHNARHYQSRQESFSSPHIHQCRRKSLPTSFNLSFNYKHVKKNVFVITATIALVIGFVHGFRFSIIKFRFSPDPLKNCIVSLANPISFYSFRRFMWVWICNLIKVLLYILKRVFISIQW